MLPPSSQTDQASQLVRIDEEQAYLLYATFCGSPVPVATALGISPKDVVRMAERGGWAEKLRPIIELHAGATSPQQIERAVNRALNWTQAHRLRIIIERTLRKLYDLSGEELLDMFQTTGKDGGKGSPSFRALADLASALEKAHQATYSALGDTAVERKARTDDLDASVSASAMQAKITDAMGQLALADDSPTRQLFSAQLEQAESLRVQVALTPEVVAAMSTDTRLA